MSFHRDGQGDWVAQLECGHRQHVRHRPPFQVRPWVQDERGRASRLGLPLGCPLCDRGELPEGLRPLRSMTWDEDSLPAALCKEHRLGASTWGSLHVLSGRIRFLRAGAAPTGTPVSSVVEAGASEGIPPGAPHRLEPAGPVRLTLQLFELRAPGLPDAAPGS